MDVQQLVISRSKRQIQLKCNLDSVSHPTMLYRAGRNLLIPYQVFSLNEKVVQTKAGGELTCYVKAEDFKFDFGNYDATSSGVLLTWLLDQIKETIDRQLVSLQFELTARVPHTVCESPEFFHPQIKVVGDSSIQFLSFANHENHLVRWSEFFEEGDPIRREIHVVYQQHYRERKPANSSAEEYREMNERIKHIVRNSL